jgi:hypothetical protein
MPKALTLANFKRRINPSLRLLSKEYVNENKEMQYECKDCGHIGLSRAGDMSKKKTGCAVCTGKTISKDKILYKKTLNKHLKSIKILKLNNKSYVRFHCSLHGEKTSTATRFQDCVLGCPKCGKSASNKNLKKTYDQLKKELIEHNYKMVTRKNEYLSLSRNSKQNLKVVCMICKRPNDIWTPNTTSGKAGCPYCKEVKFKREEMCRKIFEKLTGSVFLKKRITTTEDDFQKEDLIYFPKRSKLEFDGVSEEMKIMFEHNGELHYNRGRGIWSKLTPDQNIARDIAKMEIAKRLGYKLCVIKFTVANKNVEQFIKTWLNENGVGIKKYNCILPT